ncbi:MAG: ABC transporter substrate-binding protein, partial [Acidaminococcaceae bacterium]|nr:ABC transporter substrate-binding protein [Acidaminococcaceae bacterium]
MKFMKKMSGVLVAAVLLAAMTAGCGGGGGEKKAENKGGEALIGANYELTGNVASYGQAALAGGKMAVDEINKAGGINGKKLRIVEADNKSEPSESGNAATKLISQNKLIGLVGPATSGCTMAAEPIVTSSKLPVVAPTATAESITVGKDGKTRQFVFRACFIDPFQGKVMAAFANQKLKVKSVAIYRDNSSDYSKGLAEAFKKNFEAAGGKIVAEEAYLAKDMDFKAGLTKLKATNPEAIYVPGYYEEVGKIVKQAREIGLEVPMMGGDGWDSPKLIEIAGKAALNKTYYSSAYSADDTDPSTQKFIKAFKEKYQKDPDFFSMMGYNTVVILADAYKRAGSEDGTKIAEAMAKTKDLPVAGGKLTYDDKHNPIVPALIIEV